MLGMSDLELQSVMPANAPWGALVSLRGVRCTPTPSKPPELLPQVMHTLAEVNLQKTGQVAEEEEGVTGFPVNQADHLYCTLASVHQC